MLLLTRRKYETVVITTPSGERIEVMVVEFLQGKVRLGFTADKSVSIHRSEVQEVIDNTGRRA